MARMADIVSAVVLAAGGHDPTLVHPALSPLSWPPLPPLPLAGVLLGLLPALAAPPPHPRRRPARPRPAPDQQRVAA